MDCNEARNKLSEYTAHGLSEKGEDELLMHLESCSACVVLLETLDEDDGDLIHWPTPELSRDFEKRFWARLEKETTKPSWLDRIKGWHPGSWRVVWYPAGAVAAASLVFLFWLAGPQLHINNGVEFSKNPQMVELISSLAFFEEQDLIENLELLEEFDLLQSMDEMEEGEV